MMLASIAEREQFRSLSAAKVQLLFQLTIRFEEFNVILERFCYILIKKTRNTWNKEEKRGSGDSDPLGHVKK